MLEFKYTSFLQTKTRMKKDIEFICRLNRDWKPNNVRIKRAGGQTNRNYIVEYKNKKFFVRLPWERRDIVDRKIEAENILALAKTENLKGILSKYSFYIFKGKNILSRGNDFFDLPDGTMMTDYIEGRDINGRDLEKPKIQVALLKALCLFQTSRVRFANVYDVFRDEILKYKKAAKKYPIENLLSKKKLKEIEKIEREAKKEFPLGGRISTHNDLIFENLRLGKNSKVYLLDFEYGGLNIRQGLYYDLGIVLGGNLFQENPIKIKNFEEILKKAQQIYKRRLDKNKIYWGALINVLVMFWWGMVKYFSSVTKEEKTYFKNYVLKRVLGIKFLYKFIEWK